MRVSTSQFYLQSAQNMAARNTDVHKQATYIDSGKRVLTAKDDAVSYSSLAGYKEGINQISQYTRNITLSTGSNQQTETAFGVTQDVLLNVKSRFIQANNGSLSDDDRQSLATQMKQYLEQVLDIANSKDETGGFIFAGHQIDKQPFALQADRSVIYQGDSGINQLAISNSVVVNMNQSGDEAFVKIANAVGDFSPEYNTNNGSATVTRAVVADRGSYDVATFPPGYTLDFTDADNNGQLEVVVTDSAANPVSTIDPFVPGQPFTFNGVEVTIEGTPEVGDQFGLGEDEDVSIFETLKAAIEWLETDSTAANTSQHQIDYGHILSQINSAASHISAQQGIMGVNLQLIVSQESQHLDTNLSLEKGRSSIEDLDFYQAATTLEQSKVALEAAQLTFSKIQGLSLLNYI
ncbi:flagellar hook-associated protein FlgL [Colwellia sp. D2M02]|uniref:flagellar hook-associated protein FlgL n=1 Tax=Colwellia sp. D2M02 TaxID=2841562 RepID=UPI001C09FCE6|nr:flagellar hook-associated protein FlgL [Colwellia sp. D2M02]MBU2894914.1 flagellar hook-associated protein FlgL [Colwellia sp. D2M02]